MKKFTKILICLMLCAFGFGLVACGDPRTEEEKNFTYPSSSDVVSGNGGLAVQKGKYVYFVNGYKSIEDISNKKANYTVGSLMLMKLGDNGEVVTDDEGLTHDDYFITMNKKLCGYQVTNLFIHGNYLYFVTPCLENESGDEIWAKERVEFKRIKLDKSSDVEDVYNSGVKYDQLQYEYYQEDDQLFIMVWEKGDSYYANNGSNALIRVNATEKSSSKVANDVQSVAFAENADEIFYVKHSDDAYQLKQYNILSDTNFDYHEESSSFEVKAVGNGKVFITMSHAYGSTTDLKVSNIANHSGFQIAYAYSDSLELNFANDGTVIAVKDNAITIVKSYNDVKTIVDSSASSIDVIGFKNGCVFYYDDVSNIKYVSYSNVLAGSSAEIETLTTVDAVEADYAYFDISEDDSMMYFYKKVGENYYLHRIKVGNNMGETEEMFGVYVESDEPVVEEEEEEIEE